MLVTVPVLPVGVLLVVPVLAGRLEVGVSVSVGCETVGVTGGDVVTVVVLLAGTVDTGLFVLPPPPQADSAALANSMHAKAAPRVLGASARRVFRNDGKYMI